MTKRKDSQKQRRISEKSLANIRPYEFKKGQTGNPHGRPKTLAELRTLIQQMGAEPTSDKALTRLDLLLRGMYAARNASDRRAVLEYGWGKVSQPIDVALSDELRRLLAAVPDAERAGVAAELHSLFGQDVVVGEDVTVNDQSADA